MTDDLMSEHPAPWHVEKTRFANRWILNDADNQYIATFAVQELAEHVALMQNACAVMLRRKWQPRLIANQWTAGDLWCSHETKWYAGPWDCPFTALVEADKWYKERVES